jgi:hypothetical protein
MKVVIRLFVYFFLGGESRFSPPYFSPLKAQRTFLWSKMKKSAFLLILILACSRTFGLAADHIYFQTFTKSWNNKGRTDFLQGRLPLAVLDSLDKIYEKSPHRYLIYELGTKLYVQVACTFDLYEVNGDTLVNKYVYFNRGYSCASNSFVRENTHYILGGHGFWQNHMDLLTFDELHGSWELQITKNQPDNYFSQFVYQNSKGVYSLFGTTFNQRYAIDSKNLQGYFLDWETKAWREIELVIEGLALEELVEKGGLYFIQTQDYAFWASTVGLKNIGWNLIEKETGKIFYYESKNVDMGLTPYLEIKGNVLIYTTPSGELKALDLTQIHQKSTEVGYVRVKDVAAFGSPPSWVYLLFFVVVAAGWLVVKKTLPKKQIEDPEVLSSKKLEPIQLLLPYSGQLLTTEALDQLLGIDGQANFDSRRMKRARLINDINEQYLAQKGKELIVREKKAEDKRYVYYKIQA